MIPRITFSLFSTVLLLSCSTIPQPVPTPANSPDTTTVAETPDQPLPDTINNQVKVALADRLNVTVDQLEIGRHSRETWSDGCLGLGGAAESCLAALTEGWQIEVIDTQSGKRYFYRTDLSGDQIRLNETASSRGAVPQFMNYDSCCRDRDSTLPEILDISAILRLSETSELQPHPSLRNNITIPYTSRSYV
ncbi:MAG: hypothetical protein RIG63_15055 [Coleofasciculus chthonoplastes F3-SA18-01]|jgi:hypothetical protein|uniref:hypothetical protein n=1 Tax=Coleofasciculus chthonoplastes TaxID=64178 RepID=UPI0032FDD26F